MQARPKGQCCRKKAGALYFPGFDVGVVLCPAHAIKAVEALGQTVPLFAVPTKAVTEALRESAFSSDLYCTVPDTAECKSYYILEDVGTHSGPGRTLLQSINNEALQTVGILAPGPFLPICEVCQTRHAVWCTHPSGSPAPNMCPVCYNAESDNLGKARGPKHRNSCTVCWNTLDKDGECRKCNVGLHLLTPQEKRDRKRKRSGFDKCIEVVKGLDEHLKREYRKF